VAAGGVFLALSVPRTDLVHRSDDRGRHGKPAAKESPEPPEPVTTKQEMV
jgi:hypothetical protein